MRREQPADNEFGTLKEEIEAGRHPERRDISDQGPSYWVLWKSL